MAMGFVLGSSGSLHSPLCHSSFSSSSSSPCFTRPSLLFSLPRNAITHRKNRVCVACLPQENSKHNEFCKRREILFVGFGLIQFLNLRSEALDGFAAENAEIRMEDVKQIAEPTQGNASSNPVSLFNALGVLGSGVFASLYASAKKEKAISEAAIESVNIKLKEKEAAIVSLEKSFESKILIEKVNGKKELAKANEVHQSLVSQLRVATDAIESLENELQKERRMAEEIDIQVNYLKETLINAENSKKELQNQLKEKLDSVVVLEERISLLSSEIADKEILFQNLSSKFSEKEQECNHLHSVYQQSLQQLSDLNSEFQQLKIVLQKNEKELELKIYELENKNLELTSKEAEKEQYRRKFDENLKEFGLFKSSTEKKTASDALLLEEREKKIQQIQEQLGFVLDEVNKNGEHIFELTQEKNNLREMLDLQLKNSKSLEQELEITHETLRNSRNETSDLARQLQQARDSCTELERTIPDLQAEFTEVKESLLREIFESQEGSKVLVTELESAKELLRAANEKLLTTSQELAASEKKCDGFKKELMESNKKVETAEDKLKEEQKAVSTLNKELKILESKISRNKEARKILESDLEELTSTLDEMNCNQSTLSKDLEFANSKISSLEDEKDALYNSLDQEKRVYLEARENLEDAHMMVMKLGNERATLEKRGKKLEEELASAKGEILRLRSRINSSKPKVNEESHLEVEVGGNASIPQKKVNRRKKVKPQAEDS